MNPQYGKISFQKRLNKIQMKKRPNSSCINIHSNNTTLPNNRPYFNRLKSTHNYSQIIQPNSSILHKSMINNHTNNNNTVVSLKSGHYISSYTNKNFSKNNNPNLYKENIELQTKINLYKKEIDLLKSENNKRSEEILKRTRIIETANNNKYKSSNTVPKLKFQTTIIKLKDYYQKLKFNLLKAKENNLNLSNEIKTINVNELSDKNEKTFQNIKQIVNSFHNSQQSTFENNYIINDCISKKNIFCNNHICIEEIQKRIEEKKLNVIKLKKKLQKIKTKIETLNQTQKKITSYNESLKKQNTHLLNDKKLRQEFILQKPLYIKKITDYEQKIKSFQDDTLYNENEIKEMNEKCKKMNKEIYEEENPKKLDYKNIIHIEKKKEYGHEKILLLESLINESKRRQAEFIELLSYYEDYCEQKENYDKIQNEVELIEKNDKSGEEESEKQKIIENSKEDNENFNNNYYQLQDSSKSTPFQNNQKLEIDNNKSNIKKEEYDINKNKKVENNNQLKSSSERQKEEIIKKNNIKENHVNKEEIYINKDNKNEQKLSTKLKDSDKKNLSNKKEEQQKTSNTKDNKINEKKEEKKEAENMIKNKKSEQEVKKNINTIKGHKAFTLFLSIIYFSKRVSKEQFNTLISKYETYVDSPNFIQNLSRDFLKNLSLENENDIKFLSSILSNLLLNTFNNNQNIFLKNFVKYIIDDTKINFTDKEENSIWEKLMKIYIPKFNSIKQKLEATNSKTILYKNFKKILIDEKIYDKNNLESKRLLIYLLYILKKKSSLVDKKISILELSVEDIINFFTGLSELFDDKSEKDENNDSCISLTNEEFINTVQNFLKKLKEILNNKNISFKEFIGDKKNVAISNNKVYSVINLYKFLALLKENGYDLKDNLIISCFYREFCINENSEDMDVDKMEEELMNVK